MESSWLENQPSCHFQYLNQLEHKNGAEFVSAALSYLSSARKGLRESELLDILSLDNILLSLGKKKEP